MNYLAQEHLKHEAVANSAIELLKLKGCDTKGLNSNKGVLDFYRKLEINGVN